MTEPIARRLRYRESGAASAWRAVELALRRGDLRRQPCVECGAERTQAHHHQGYDPEAHLAVTWLCPVHHAAAHRLR